MAFPATLAADITSGATSLTLQTGGAAKLPTLTGSNYIWATIFPANQVYGGGSSAEIIKITTVVGEVLTVVRGQQRTTAQTHVFGDKLEIRVTATGMGEITPAGQQSADNIHALTAGTTLAAADELNFWDSVALLRKRLTYANLLATLKAAGGTWVHNVTGNISGGTVAGTTITGSSTVRGNTAVGSGLSAAVVGVSSGSGIAITGSSAGGYAGYFAGDPTSPLCAAFHIDVQDTQPTTGFLVGDMYVSTAGKLIICTVAGTPGTWVVVGTQT